MCYLLSAKCLGFGLIKSILIFNGKRLQKTFGMEVRFQMSEAVAKYLGISGGLFFERIDLDNPRFEVYVIIPPKKFSLAFFGSQRCGNDVSQRML